MAGGDAPSQRGIRPWDDIARARSLRKDEAFFSTAYTDTTTSSTIQTNVRMRQQQQDTQFTRHNTFHLPSPHRSISTSTSIIRSSLLSSLHHLSSQFQFAPVVPLIWNEKKWNFILADHIGLPLAVCGGNGGRLGFT